MFLIVCAPLLRNPNGKGKGKGKGDGKRSTHNFLSPSVDETAHVADANVWAHAAPLVDHAAEHLTIQEKVLDSVFH